MSNLFPVRCFTCGKVLKSYSKYEELIKITETQDSALDKLGMIRLCCRRFYLSYAKSLDENLLLYDMSSTTSAKLNL